MLTRDLLLALLEGWPVPPEAVQAFGANLGAGEIIDARLEHLLWQFVCRG